MTVDRLFSIANMTALVCWGLLVVWPARRSVTHLIAGRIVPAIFAVLYVAIVAVEFPGAQGGFDTLVGVHALFQNRWMLLAGWLHYLAFDLLVGTWEARDALARGVPRWLLVPCLLLTFIFGPTGWLAYLVARRRYRALSEQPGIV